MFAPASSSPVPFASHDIASAPLNSAPVAWFVAGFLPQRLVTYSPAPPSEFELEDGFVVVVWGALLCPNPGLRPRLHEHTKAPRCFVVVRVSADARATQPGDSNNLQLVFVEARETAVTPSLLE